MENNNQYKEDERYFIEHIEQIVKDKFLKLGLNENLGQLTESNRKELGQFQCNGAFKASKDLKTSPLAVAEQIKNLLLEEEIFSLVTISNPGFINLTLNNSYLSSHLNKLSKNNIIEIPKKNIKETIILDYGGVNIAKSMHIGHLRSAVAGESLKRIFREFGDDVISDIHLGDWGLPMGMLIAELKITNPDWCYFDQNFTSDDFKTSPITLSELEILYPRAAIKCKEDPDARDIARNATKELQQGNKGYIALWKRFVEVSVTDIKRQFDLINVSFDLWLGESSVNDIIPNVIKSLKDKDLTVIDDGALIINIQEESDKKPIPPVMLATSDDTITYAMTDIATIVSRVKSFNPTKIMYVVDKRQSLHFEQVFRVTDKAIIYDLNKLEFIGFGTINGLDNKPFKTRDGAAMPLAKLVSMVTEKAAEKIVAENIASDNSEIEKQNIIELVSIATIKFADLSMGLNNDYIFDIDKFTSFQGCTGPYLLYSAVRIKSLIVKATIHGLNPGEIKIEDDYEIALALKLIQFPNIMNLAYNNRAPNILCDYIYSLAQSFSSFYQNCHIIKESDKNKAESRLALTYLIVSYIEKILYLLGISIPQSM